MKEDDEKQPTPSFSEKLFDALMAFYIPAETPASADEMKSTQDLIEEMEQILQSISPNEVNAIMKTNGFKLHYTGNGYVWLLKTR
ncbi:MAG TPA: hypothetical protein VFC67_25190 [Prolixibacteraceae bacterium]|nr:hypothetical protein [Prolixibacteraceae bacterium]